MYKCSLDEYKIGYTVDFDTMTLFYGKEYSTPIARKDDTPFYLSKWHIKKGGYWAETITALDELLEKKYLEYLVEKALLGTDSIVTIK